MPFPLRICQGGKEVEVNPGDVWKKWSTLVHYCDQPRFGADLVILCCEKATPFFFFSFVSCIAPAGWVFCGISRTSPMYRAWSGLKGLAKRRQIDHCSLTYVHPFPRTYSRWSTQDIPDLTVHGGLRLHVSERLYDGTPPGVVMGCCLRLTALVVFYSHQAAMNCALRISLDSQWWSHLVCRSQRPGLRVKLDAWASGFRHLTGEGSWMNTDVKCGPYICIRMNWQKIIFTRKLCEVQNPTSDSHG